MKFEPYQLDRIAGVGYKKTKNFTILEQFLDSNEPCAEIKEYVHRDCYSCANSLKRSVELFHMNDILVKVFGGRIFLIRKSELKKRMKKEEA